MLRLYHLLTESVGEDVARVEGDVVWREDIAVVDGCRAIDAVGSPLLQILAYLLVVVVGGGAGITEPGKAAPLGVGGAAEIDESCLDGTDQPEAVESLVAVRGIGLREGGGDDMEADDHITMYGVASKLAPSDGIELDEDSGRREGSQLRESCGVLVPQADMVDSRDTG